MTVISDATKMAVDELHRQIEALLDGEKKAMDEKLPHRSPFLKALADTKIDIYRLPPDMRGDGELPRTVKGWDD